VEAAEEEGIIEPEQADLIEQVVEFSDKRVREVMTPRPDIVALPADATLEDLHARVVETKLNKIPVYEKSLDDIFGVVYSQDLLQIADQDLLSGRCASWSSRFFSYRKRKLVRNCCGKCVRRDSRWR